MVKCKYGKLAVPVRERGSIRRCKLKKKTKIGRKLDRATPSSEYHEIRYRKLKRAKRKSRR